MLSSKNERFQENLLLAAALLVVWGAEQRRVRRLQKHVRTQRRTGIQVVLIKYKLACTMYMCIIKFDHTYFNSTPGKNYLTAISRK